jgi:hypothetical protein
MQLILGKICMAAAWAIWLDASRGLNRRQRGRAGNWLRAGRAASWQDPASCRREALSFIADL